MTGHIYSSCVYPSIRSSSTLFLFFKFSPISSLSSKLLPSLSMPGLWS